MCRCVFREWRKEERGNPLSRTRMQIQPNQSQKSNEKHCMDEDFSPSISNKHMFRIMSRWVKAWKAANRKDVRKQVRNGRLRLHDVNFKEVAPPTAESEERVNTVYRLPAIDRTFTTHVPSSSQYSSSEMSAPAKIPEVFDLDELDSYSDQVQVKKEPSPKATASSKPSSSKAIIIPKPSPATKPRSSSSHKRKEPDSPVISDTFPYEKHGFIEASGFMTSFLNQGLERLVHLYQESCRHNKTLESKLKEAEITISDQGMIAAGKSRHYEEKFKAMTQEHQTALNRATLQAQADLEAVHMQHEQDMVSYRESLKSSVVISLLQARLKMAHEAKALGFECPSWDVGAWETKLKNLGGTSSKPAIVESSKAVEKATHTEKDAEEDHKTDAAEIIMDEEDTAP
ncbi:hypothetical protein HanLR1_Chr11g0391561 [Helianthus annuus]|nr:hypothetical protein HanHA89_Chr11g0414221 [Helianthus annuus]KAJ0684472.1 hypothetical protein HanLR1_Chr11g0391561 [Helianthus annuus]